MTKEFLLLTVVSILITSCATSVRRGVVAMKLDENTAHVSLNQSEVSVGDHVELYSNKCNNKYMDQQCKKVPKGHGTVTSVINSDYVVIKFDSGVAFQEGDFIEKHSH